MWRPIWLADLISLFVRAPPARSAAPARMRPPSQIGAGLMDLTQFRGAIVRRRRACAHSIKSTEPPNQVGTHIGHRGASARRPTLTGRTRRPAAETATRPVSTQWAPNGGRPALCTFCGRAPAPPPSNGARQRAFERRPSLGPFESGHFLSPSSPRTSGRPVARHWPAAGLATPDRAAPRAYCLGAGAICRLFNDSNEPASGQHPLTLNGSISPTTATATATTRTERRPVG